MGKIIAIANQKGGVGKTTTSINITASLQSIGQRALLVDLDPQGNATMGSGINKNELEHTALDALLGEATFAEVVQFSEAAGYSVLPSNSDMTAADVELHASEKREQRLKLLLDGVMDQFDYIIIDCPPSLNMLTLNALIAADGVLIPMQCEYFALEGLSALMETIENIKSAVNPNLAVEGILRTMFDPRNNLANEVSAQLIRHFSDLVYRTVIPRNVRLAEAPSHGLPATVYDRASKGAIAYLALASEIHRRQQKNTQQQEQQKRVSA
ncbi:MAG: ParA family protein [Methylococcales bacterium]|jgi:chromosome partitioning protein|nr:ParA family protein [Methylococcales bacterium]MBT7444310.1 ParA family protein [Methylococcales bacterium]